MNILSIVTIAVISLMTAYSIYLVNREKNKLACMSGMMIAMAVAMMDGLLSGYAIGVYSGDMFLSCGFGLIIGFIIGFLAGQPIGLMAALNGAIAGLMSGLMGAMLGVILQIENPSIMLGILLGMYVIILGLVILFILVETNDRFTLDTQAISPFAILSAGVVLVTLLLFLYSNDIIKIPGNTASIQAQVNQTASSPSATQTEIDVTKENAPKIKMEVSQTGYSPNVIRVKKGVPVELEIKNPLENSCLSTFTLPEFNINNVNLKVGTTNLSFTPDKTGEYTLAVGWECLKGLLL
ncbi:cupredoxin domain-containing protein [Neobacillus pocheonensis]|uniref:Cupredoxin domain-containing protein n=1 Tax=Neobacillus pocheonensis TaxID=363869 RepID=A0ABT0WA41_9BACI|nr:cupredoxin domain-containing protein [Neobacillus pocheonensis]